MPDETTPTPAPPIESPTAPAPAPVVENAPVENTPSMVEAPPAPTVAPAPTIVPPPVETVVTPLPEPVVIPPIATSTPPAAIPTPPVESAPPIENPPIAPTISPAPVPAQSSSPISSLKNFLLKAKEKIQFRKRQKLEKILALARQKGSITNDQVQKLLHVSDATASRYLSQLVKESRLVRQGKQKKPVYRLP